MYVPKKYRQSLMSKSFMFFIMKYYLRRLSGQKIRIRSVLKFTYNFVHTWFIKKERILNILKGYNLNIYYKFIQSLSSEGGWYGLKKKKKDTSIQPS